MSTPSPELAALLLRLGNLLGQAVRPSTMQQELGRAAGGLRQLFGAAACSVALVEQQESALRFVAADGAGSRAIMGVTMPINRGIAGWVAMSGQGIATSDVTSDTRFARDVAEATEYVPTSILAAPLVEPDGTVIGVIEVLDPELDTLDTGRALDLLGTVGDQLASIVRLAGTYDQLGHALLSAAGDGDGGADGFARALRALGGADSEEHDRELSELAATLHELTSLGPEAAALARRILQDVVAYARTRR